MNEDKLHQTLNRAAQAEALMRSEILKDAFQTLEQDLIRSWAGTTPEEKAVREDFWKALQISGQLLGILKKYITDGRVAQAELDELIKRRKAA